MISDVLGVAALAGLHADPVQQMILQAGLRKGEDGKWATFRMRVPRQEADVLVIRELGALALLGETVLHISPGYAAARSAFERLSDLIMSIPEFARRVHRITSANGAERIDMTQPGGRIRFLSRPIAHGFSADLIVADFTLTQDDLMALIPVLSARPDPQIWIAGS